MRNIFKKAAEGERLVIASKVVVIERLIYEDEVEVKYRLSIPEPFHGRTLYRYIDDSVVKQVLKDLGME